MAKSEAYEAFKARRRREFDSRYAGRTTATQQKLLRVHLRHFMATVGADIESGRRQVGTRTYIKPYDENELLKRDENAALRGFAVEQKRLAVEREKARAQRHRSARVIQSFFRRCSKQRENAAIEGEIELPSTSILIALEVEKPVVPPVNPILTAPVDVYLPSVDGPRSTALPPYEVVVELLSARDLALGLGSGGAYDGKNIEVELLLKRQSKVLARAVPTKQFVSSFHDNSAEIQLQDCSLRFPIDLGNGMKYGISSPQSVVEELNATVIVKASGGGANILGIVGIPLSLLEPPLATEYALCRWFPLERAYPGHTARGDLRVSVCYLMRQASSDTFTMVPYVNTINQKDPDEENATPQQLKKTTSSRGKKAATTAAAQRKATNCKLFQRRRLPESTDQAANDSEKPKHPVLSLKNSLSSPIGRISRAEALSPPSSPSSMTSSEAGDSPRSIDLPQTTRLAKTARRFFPPKQRKPALTSPPEEESIVETKANSPRSPPKNFLKRKPYKVVFQKLDWSRVASKTDSNLSSSRSSRTNSGVSSRSSRASQSSSRASSSSLVADNDADTEVNTASNVTNIPIFIDADTAQRLTALETAVLERCCVTKETASLARFKYQAERKKFVATLQAQAQARVQAEPEQVSSHGSSEMQVSETVVTELWKKLSGDASGQIYAAMLRGFTERPAKPIEPTEETGS